MEARAEPRFKTDSATLIEVVRDQACTFDGRITDVSALGFQIEMAQPLMVGETIRLTVDGYHMFGQVRRCVPTGSLFKIGVERIDQWDSPLGGPARTSPVEADSPVVVADSPVLGRPVFKNPLGNLRAIALRELFTGSHPQATKQPDNQEVAKFKYRSALIVAGCIALTAWAGGVVAWKSQAHPPSGKIASSNASASNTRPDQPATPANTTPANTTPVNTAPVSVAPASTTPANTAPLNSTQSNSTPLNTTPAAKAPVITAPANTNPLITTSAKLSNTGTGTPPPVQKTPVAVSSTVTAVPGAGLAHSLSLKATDISWVTACVDGKNLFSKLFKKGDVEEVPFSRLAVVRSGNAGALELAIGKESIGAMGTSGATRTIKVTPSGHEFVAPALATNCSAQ